MMVDMSFASVPDPFLLCLQFVSCPLSFGNKVYYSYASVIILPYIVVETYDCVHFFLC